MAARPDFVVVGAGIAGLATALELAAGGARVRLLDRGKAGQESSWAGGGILSPLMPWHYAAAVNDLVALSLTLYPEWTAALTAASGIDPQLSRSGLLLLPPYDAAQAQAWCARYDWPLETVSAQARVPQLAADSPALWLPDVCQVRNPRLLAALRAAVCKAGVDLREDTEVTGVRCAGGRITALETGSEVLSAGGVVLTGGAWSSTLLGGLAHGLDIRPVRGQMLLYQGPPGRLTHMVYAGGAYIIPRLDGHILTGSTLEEVGFDAGTTAEARLEMSRRAETLLPWLATLPVERQWAGLRPGSPNNVPVIDRHPELDNLWANTGQFRYGITMAPASAQLLANAVFGRTQPIDVAPYAWPASARSA